LDIQYHKDDQPIKDVKNVPFILEYVSDLCRKYENNHLDSLEFSIDPKFKPDKNGGITGYFSEELYHFSGGIVLFPSKIDNF